MKEKVNIGYIGLGRRGYGVLDRCFSQMNDVCVKTICDVSKDRIEHSLDIYRKNGAALPAVTSDYHEILNDPSIDGVVIMTGWHDHLKLAEESVRAGKYTAVEVGCCYDLSECYALLDAYETTKAPLMMLENCCYGRREMAALNMVKLGLFGEVVHCEGGYHHYLNDMELFLKDENGVIDTNHYRLAEYANRNCEQYPTHELGPINKILNINRGNRYVSLASFSSKAAGLRSFIKDHVPASHPMSQTNFRQGDIVDTIITCANGETIHIQLDTTTPRPYYSRAFEVRGTKGMVIENGNGKATWFLDGMKEEVFDNESEFFSKYDHPLYEEYEKLPQKGGHGGIDWLVMRGFVEAIKHGENTPVDIYDTLTLLSIAPLSEMSLAQGSAPVAVPDFTKGKWFRREVENHTRYSLDAIVTDDSSPIIP